ncbi:hypothetical protein KsCSTR_07710 [Candidatus Kuenenia stuttgartiensis]|uniref:Uncharacterized protein n=1 Tax=Kuenenia stuttgartiensis TaxID=174633 RepID=A0A6G7GKK3_KUEST|nr:hypothetical protein KsCSTR_07710 [Candidatus Kuenenia stuttgartiensis]
MEGGLGQVEKSLHTTCPLFLERNLKKSLPKMAEFDVKEFQSF